MIPKKIKNLVDLALRDGVITYRERKAIVKEGVKMNVPSKEMHAYMDERLKSIVCKMPKEDIQHCPQCGGQVPLLSDECLYCGGKLTPSVRVYGTQGYAGDSEAVRIIHEENDKTANNEGGKSDKKNASGNCPDCGAKLPLLSNLCPYCGHIEKEANSSCYDVNNIIQEANDHLMLMDDCKVSFGDVLKDKKHILYGLLSTLFLVMDTLDEDLCLILSLLFGILSIFAFVKHNGNSDTIVVKADRMYYLLKSDFETLVRHTESLYGGNKEARLLIKQFEEASRSVEKSKRQNRIKFTLVFLGLVAAIFVVSFFSGTESGVLRSSRRYYSEVFRTVDLRKTLDLGVVTDGKVITDVKELNEIGQYFEIDGKAKLSVQGVTSGYYGLFDSHTLRKARLRLSNVHLTSKGCEHLEAESIKLACMILDYQGNPLDCYPIMLEESIIYKDSALHTLPDSSLISFRNLLRGESGGYYANFVSIDTLKNPQQDPIKQFFDQAASFIIYFTK